MRAPYGSPELTVATSSIGTERYRHRLLDGLSGIGAGHGARSQGASGWPGRGLARMKSALRSGWRSLWKLSPWAICPSMPRIARFILASRQVV